MKWQCSLCEDGQDIAEFCGGCCDAFVNVITGGNVTPQPNEFFEIHPIAERILKTPDGHALAKKLFNPKRWGVEDD